jgi:DNA-binding SARP family transcriptional activator/tetratricopeptide (TPR) repeat protein
VALGSPLDGASVIRHMDFRLLGPLEVLENGTAIDVGAAKPRALLAVLLLKANHVVSSDELLEALWDEQPPGTALKALQVYVSQLRKALGKERILTRVPGYELRVEPGELDLERFKTLVAEEKLEQALLLWRGQPLADFRYELFAQADIARLEELRIACLEDRIESDLRTGRHPALVGEIDALVREHPLRERLRAQLMLALYRSGRDAEALEAYQDARRTLVEELGIEPRRELRELQQAILLQDPALDLVAEQAPLESTRGAFVGRGRELEELLVGLEDAVAGHGRLFLLVGEPGIGKSRLADELIGRARARGARVLVGRCWEAGGAPAYWPWVQSMRACVRETEPETLRAQLGTGASSLAQLLPELRELFPDLPEPPAIESEGARFRLFEATSSFLQSAARNRPLLLVLDDLHAADEPSLLLLQFLARELAESRLLVVGAYRDVDPSPTDPLTAALTELSREPVTATVALAGLGERDVARFIELASDDAASEELIAAIYEETEGNPLFVGEIVRLLATEGRLEDEHAPRFAIPQSVRDVIARRLRHLSEECNRALVLASVLGREFDLDALAHMGGVSENALLGSLDEAMTARVVSDVPGSRTRLRFAHILIRDTLYDGLTTARRVRLHRLAVDALEALYGDEPGPHLAELAYHSIAGSDFDKGLRYAQRAGDRALALLAYEEAARLYETALEALELQRRMVPVSRCELLLALGDALAKAGNTPEAKDTFLAAADLARSSRLPEHLARAALGYGGRFQWLRAGNDRRLVPLLEEALAALGEESALRVRLLARLAGALRDQPSLEPRSSLSRQAVEIARRLGDPDTLGYALVNLAMATWGPEAEELAAIADEVSGLAQQTDDAERAFQACWLHHITSLTLGDHGRVAALADEHRALADELKQPSQQWYSAVMRAAWALLRGEFSEGEQLTEEALRLGRRAQTWDADFAYRIALFVLRREQGRLKEIEELIRLSLDEHPGYRSFRALVPVLEWELGREDEAWRAFDELAAADFAVLPRDGEWLFSLSILAEAAARFEDGDRAAILYQLLDPYARLNASTSGASAIGSVSRYLGILASTMSRWDDARSHFEDALAMNDRMGARPWLAHTQHDYARLLVARGTADDRAKGDALLATALTTYRELGMVGPLAKAESTAAM